MAKGIMYIDGQRVPFDGEKNVLAVIRKAGIDMPTFCYYSELSVYGACRMCVVEDEKGKIDASCSMEPRDGMVIRTNTAKLLKHRRMILELMLSSHCRDCTTCEKSGSCRLQELALRFGVRHVRFQDTRPHYELDESSPALVRDPNKCILCGDCIRACEELQGIGALGFAYRGTDAMAMPQTALTASFGEFAAIADFARNFAGATTAMSMVVKAQPQENSNEVIAAIKHEFVLLQAHNAADEAACELNLARNQEVAARWQAIVAQLSAPELKHPVHLGAFNEMQPQERSA